MGNISQETIIEALRKVQDPELHRDIVSLGMVKDLGIDNGRVRFTVELTTPACPLRETIETDCKKALSTIPGITGLEINFGAQVRGSKAGAGQTDLLPTVKDVVLVAAGKGGVGKSLFSFDSQTLESLLVRAGFDQVRIDKGRKTLSPGYVIAHFDRFPVPVISPLGRLAKAVLPRVLLHQRVTVVATGIDVLAHKNNAGPIDRRRPRLSVVMPVFNERATFTEVATQLVNKEIPGLDIELVIVKDSSPEYRPGVDRPIASVALDGALLVQADTITFEALQAAILKARRQEHELCPAQMNHPT